MLLLCWFQSPPLRWTCVVIRLLPPLTPTVCLSSQLLSRAQSVWKYPSFLSMSFKGKARMVVHLATSHVYDLTCPRSLWPDVLPSLDPYNSWPCVFFHRLPNSHCVLCSHPWLILNWFLTSSPVTIEFH